jgi:ABC-2 type transport system permease protein
MIVLRRLLADRRRGAVWWTLGTVFGVASIVGLWPSVRGNGDIEDVVRNLPTGLRSALGIEEGIGLSTAPGYLQARLFSTVLPVLFVIYGIGLGARLVGGAEEDGTLQLVTTSPVTRRRIVVERFVASKVLVLWLVLVGLATTLSLGAVVGLFDDVSVGRTVVDTIAVAELSLLFLTIAFAAGAATGRRAPALSVASGVAVGTYVLHALAASAEAIRPLRVLSPWWWFLDRNLLVHDPTFLALGLPLVVSAAVFVYGLVAYERRDLKYP